MRNKKYRLLIIIACAMLLVSMVGTAMMESVFIGAKRTEYTVNLTELAGMINENNEKTGRDIQIHFTQNKISEFHFRLFVPSSATAENPAPGIVVCHGGTNVLELQMPFYVELARRGFVVISMDMSGHGETDNAIGSMTANSNGMLAAVEFLMSMPEVDPENIGVTGHSFGNNSCVNTLAVLNTPDSTQRVKAWVDGDGLRYLASVTPDIAEGLYLTIGVAKYGETNMPNGYAFLSGPTAMNLLGIFSPSFSGDAAENNQWYTSSGPVDIPAAGTALDTDGGLKIVQYKGTHPMWHFSLPTTAIAINGFYESLGVPAGRSYIPANKQVWPLEVCFELLGLLGFFLLLFPVVAILADSKLFSRIKRSYPEGDALPAFKSGRTAIITILTIVACMLFSYFSYAWLGKFNDVGPDGPSLFNANAYPAEGMATNFVGLWTLICGAFTLVMILVNYGAQWLFGKKDREKLGNPFGSLAADSASQFLYTILFAVVVVAILYIPVVIASLVFKADFRICTLAVQIGRLRWLPTIILRYLPLWLMFYVPYAAMNSNTRFKDMPEWLSTLICALANGIPLTIFLFVQYSNIFSKGTVMPYNSMAGLIAFTLIPVLAFAAVSSRYIYKKTGSAWAAGTINGLIFCLMMVYGNAWRTDFILM
ncbi:MAG: hypothetical protein IJK63_07700 [Oscillospiraceae bacterium]|nr:hypothetical protein [Oscillospiraceae bacterium]